MVHVVIGISLIYSHIMSIANEMNVRQHVPLYAPSHSKVALTQMAERQGGRFGFTTSVSNPYVIVVVDDDYGAEDVDSDKAYVDVLVVDD